MPDRTVAVSATVSNAAVRRLQSSAGGRTSIPDAQLYTCGYAQLLMPMDNSANARSGAGRAVIRVEAAGLCRSDWHGWQGHDPDIPSLPHTPGHELAGVVHAVGDGVTRVHVSDRVVVPFICGCASARGACQAARRSARTSGSRVSTVRGATPNSRRSPGPTSTSSRLAAVMIACSRGARVIGIDINSHALALAVQAGAEITVDAGTGDAVEMIRAVMPQGVDVAVDALGSAGTESGITIIRP
jgi:D-arabinose 1-dehydrogenase-like Zn-dependent alcohol dehydrogenase